MSADGPVAIAWSGGKDSTLALLDARGAGERVETFVTMFEADGASLSHALPPALVAAQVAAFGGRSLAVEVEPGAYAAAFDAVLSQLFASGHRRMVFGDIDLEAHRRWIEAACARAGMMPLFPLWGRPRAEVAAAVIATGIRARVITVRSDVLDADFCGRNYDAAFLADLPATVCPCGENGEFHTFVFDAPGMAAAVGFRALPRRVLPAEPPQRPAARVVEPLALAGEGR